MSGIRNVDGLALRLQRSIRASPLLYRLTLGTRVLLAAGFIPTGLVKLLGLRFSLLGPEHPVGSFFEMLYQSGLYWQFLGAAQILAGLLVLLPATATLGALIFFGIIVNVFVITLSFDFAYTPVVTGMMLMATLYLLAWDYDRLRSLVGISTQETSRQENLLPLHRLSGPVERGVYVTGTVVGIAFFTATRGLYFSYEWALGLFAACVLSFLVALWFGFVHGRGKGHRVRDGG